MHRTPFFVSWRMIGDLVDVQTDLEKRKRCGGFDDLRL